MKHSHHNQFNPQASRFTPFHYIHHHLSQLVSPHIVQHRPYHNDNGKGTKQTYNKVDEFLQLRTKNYSSDHSSASAYSSKSTHSKQTHSIKLQQKNPLNISITSTIRTARISNTQDSQTATSSKHSHDSNWTTSQPEIIPNPRAPTQHEIETKLTTQQYSKQFQLISIIETKSKTINNK